MPQDNPDENTGIYQESLQDTNGYCPNCHHITYFTVDKELGYYKQCPRCGHAEHLNRRFLKFDRHSRQWL